MWNFCFLHYHHLLALSEGVCEHSCLTLWFLFILFRIKADRLASIPAGMWAIRWVFVLVDSGVVVVVAALDCLHLQRWR